MTLQRYVKDIYIQSSKDCTYGVLADCQCILQVGSLSISAQPMRLVAEGLGFLDPLLSYLLQRISDEMVDTGWITKSTYLLTFQ